MSFTNKFENTVKSVANEKLTCTQYLAEIYT